MSMLMQLRGLLLVHLVGYWIAIVQIIRLTFTNAMKRSSYVKQEGKVFVVTGALQGIGRKAVERLLALDAYVIITGRSSPDSLKVKQSLEELTSFSTRFRYVQLELETMDEIVKFCDSLKSEYSRLDGLVCNAGQLESDFSRLTKDGFEIQQTVNYLSNVLLVEKLQPLLEEAKGRVVLVASAIHVIGYCDLDDFMLQKSRSSYLGYVQSKLAQISYTKYICKSLRRKNITINAIHPGCVATGLYSPLIRFIGSFFLMNPATSAESILCPLISLNFEGVTGEYMEFCEVTRPHKKTLDVEFQKELFKLTQNYLQKWIS